MWRFLVLALFTGCAFQPRGADDVDGAVGDDDAPMPDPDGGNEDGGGCNAGGGTSSALFALAFAGVLAQRRRRRA